MNSLRHIKVILLIRSFSSVKYLHDTDIISSRIISSVPDVTDIISSRTISSSVPDANHLAAMGRNELSPLF